jgi:hypothetical protein
MNICKICKQEIDNRTNMQNRYLHKVIGIIADHIGYSHLVMKCLLKKEFGYYAEEVNKKTGEVIPVYYSTADLSKKEFALFTEKILHLANSNGIRIETPEEYHRRISETETNKFINSNK